VKKKATGYAYVEKIREERYKRKKLFEYKEEYRHKKSMKYVKFQRDKKDCNLLLSRART